MCVLFGSAELSIRRCFTRIPFGYACLNGRHMLQTLAVPGARRCLLTVFRSLQTRKTKLNRTPRAHNILACGAVVLDELAACGTRSDARYVG